MNAELHEQHSELATNTAWTAIGRQQRHHGLTTFRYQCLAVSFPNYTYLLHATLCTQLLNEALKDCSGLYHTLVLSSTNTSPWHPSSRFDSIIIGKKVRATQTLSKEKQRLFDLELYAAQHTNLCATGWYADREVIFAPKFITYLTPSALAITFCLVLSFWDTRGIWRVQIEVHKHS